MKLRRRINSDVMRSIYLRSRLNMKFGAVIFLLCLPLLGQGQEPPPGLPRIADPVKFDEWGDLPFRDEKARLDNAAISLSKNSGYIMYLVVSAGSTACVGEAKARGSRAKNYLVRKRHVNEQQIVWIDGGHEDTVTTVVWIWPADMKPPSVFPEFNLKPNQITLERKCRIKCRACRRTRRITNRWTRAAGACFPT
jgi:hypothetical protein